MLSSQFKNFRTNVWCVLRISQKDGLKMRTTGAEVFRKNLIFILLVQS